jgi:hypothetical protein
VHGLFWWRGVDRNQTLSKKIQSEGFLRDNHQENVTVACKTGFLFVSAFDMLVTRGSGLVPQCKGVKLSWCLRSSSTSFVSSKHVTLRLQYENRILIFFNSTMSREMLNDELRRSMERERELMRAIRTERYRVEPRRKKTNGHAIF